MIKSISIQGFKSLQDIQMELGQVNVLIGANGSGKSNLLEAVGVLSAAISGRVDDQSLARRGVRLGVPALYKTSLKGDRIPTTITLSVNQDDDDVYYAVSLDNPIKNPEPSWRYRTENLKKGGKRIVSYSAKGTTFVSHLSSSISKESLKLQAYSGLVSFIQGYKELDGEPRELINILTNYAIFSPVTSVLRGLQTDQAREPVGLFGGRLPEAVEDLLSKAGAKFGEMDLDELFTILDWVSDMDIVSPSRQLLSPSIPALRRVIRFQDRWMREKRNELSGYDASEGALYVLFMLTLAMHPKTPQLFAIDNFDQAMHPRLVRALARTFCKQVLDSKDKKQVLLTTHNPLVLDGLNLRDERIRLFAVERGNIWGETKIRRVQISDTLMNKAQEDGFSLSSLWVMGRLGGVPDL